MSEKRLSNNDIDLILFLIRARQDDVRKIPNDHANYKVYFETDVELEKLKKRVVEFKNAKL